MAEVSVPSIATVTATNSDKVLGVQTGAVKLFNVSDIRAGANPSVTVGLTAKNGTATTSMRSDAAPALDPTIAPTIASADGKVAQAANVNVPALYVVPVSGIYRVSVFLVLSQAATTSSVLPSCSVSYTEATTGAAVADLITQTANTNLVGLHTSGTAVIQAQAGSNVGYSTGSYASSGATPMQYAVQVKIERVG